MSICIGKYFWAAEKINKVQVCAVLYVLLRFKNKNKVFWN